jgi:cytoskeletal protein CcmA (bactofilin family)
VYDVKKFNGVKLLALTIMLFAAAFAGALGAAATPAFAQEQPEVVVQVDEQNRVAFDEDLTIEEGEIVQGSASVTNGDLEVFGAVAKNATVVNGDADIHGTIGGDLAVLASGDVTLHPGSKVAGNVVANGDIELQAGSVVNGSVTSLGGTVLRRTGAQVAGGLNQVDGPGKAIENFVKPWAGMSNHGSVAGDSGSNWEMALARFGGIFGMGMFSVLVLGLSFGLTAIMPGRVRTTTYTLQSEPGSSIIVGLITALLLFPVAGVLAVLLTISMVGIVLLPLLAIAVLGVLLFGFVVVGYWLGKRIHDSARPGGLSPNGLNGHNTPALAIEVIIGTAIILGSLFVPAMFLPPWASIMLLGVVYLVSCLGVGAAILSRFGTLAPPKRLHSRTVMYPTPVHSHYGSALPHTPAERQNTRPLGQAPTLPVDEHTTAR